MRIIKNPCPNDIGIIEYEITSYNIGWDCKQVPRFSGLAGTPDKLLRSNLGKVKSNTCLDPK